MSDTSFKISPKFKGNYIIRGKIECITGLHIGGSKEKMEIGGVDAPVMRNPKTRMPFIPGSSIKGKLRHILEYALGVVGEVRFPKPDGKYNPGDVSEADEIVRIFGIGANDDGDENQEKWKMGIGPSRLIVRDCNPDAATIKMWEEEVDSELLYTEYKPENTINRVTAAANPRFMERVVAGSTFDFEMVYSIIEMGEADETEQIQKDLEHLMRGLMLLQHNALGKAGTRGYGKIKFHLADPIHLKMEDYISESDKFAAAEKDLDAGDLKPINKVRFEYPQKTTSA